MAENEKNKWHISNFVANDQQKNYFAIVATLVLLIILLLLIYPAIRHVSKVNKEITDAKVIKNSLEEKIQNIEQAKINLEAVEEDLALLDLALPVGADLVPYLQKIESFAKKYKLSIDSAQFVKIPLSKPPVTADLDTKQFDYNFTFSGDYVNFNKFLADLENYIRTSDVKTIQIAKEEDKITESIQVTSYYIGLELQEKETTTDTSGGVNE